MFWRKKKFDPKATIQTAKVIDPEQQKKWQEFYNNLPEFYEFGTQYGQPVRMYKKIDPKTGVPYYSFPWDWRTDPIT